MLAIVATDSEVNLHLLWQATIRQVDSYAARVAENRDVMQALDFARFVLNSRLVNVLVPYGRGGELKVDPGLLRWKAEELQRACTDRFRMNDCKPHIEQLQLEAVHEKLDLVAGYLSKLVLQGAVMVELQQPSLSVISGGLDEGPSVVGSEVKGAS